MAKELTAEDKIFILENSYQMSINELADNIGKQYQRVRSYVVENNLQLTKDQAEDLRIKKDKETKTSNKQENSNNITADVGRCFTLTTKQNNKLKKWKKSLPQPKKSFGVINHGYTFLFIPTGLGVIEKVKRDDGFEIDLTDYDCW